MKKILNPKIPDPERQLAYLAYVNRENEFQHHGYDEEMKQYLMMQSGDPGAVEESQRMMRRAFSNHAYSSEFLSFVNSFLSSVSEMNLPPFS